MPETFSVFASVGNGVQPFHRFMKILREGLAIAGSPDCLLQCGHTEVEPIPNCTIRPFLGREEYEWHLKNSGHSFLHAGAGSIFMTLRDGRRPAILARRAEHHEIIDNHQLQLVDFFGQQELIYVIEDSADLAAYLQLHDPRPKSRVQLTTSQLLTRIKHEILEPTR